MALSLSPILPDYLDKMCFTLSVILDWRQTVTSQFVYSPRLFRAKVCCHYSVLFSLNYLDKSRPPQSRILPRLFRQSKLAIKYIHLCAGKTFTSERKHGSLWPSGEVSVLGQKNSRFKIHRVWGLLHVKSYEVAKRPTIGVVCKFGEELPVQVSSSSSDHGSKLRIRPKISL
ncbi:hypothetical protein AVEN_230092-1 [Araneus ventricosus]|uniref:Uncharacterized protein n=1 Tax=Araneus ventricosus TaxID=182803 RepID=A0A4Y2MGE6_ARAVE|nr:hypothetical protein AVEN_230092-1 [Araneus ventricosus]